MTDIEAIRERHRMTRRPEHRPEGVAAWERCALDEQDWPCDAARFMAESDRWREDAESLAQALRSLLADDWIVAWDGPSGRYVKRVVSNTQDIERAREALAAHDVMTGEPHDEEDPDGRMAKAKRRDFGLPWPP